MAWTQAQTDTAVAMWANNDHVNDIAAAVGKSPSTVCQRAHNYRELFPKRSNLGRKWHSKTKPVKRQSPAKPAKEELPPPPPVNLSASDYDIIGSARQKRVNAQSYSRQAKLAERYGRPVAAAHFRNAAKIANVEADKIEAQI